MAWLHTSADEHDKKKSVSRADKFSGFITYETPEYYHLAELLFEAGPGIGTGYGLSVLPWSEIEAFCRMSGVELSHWESRLLRKISRIYCSGLNQYDGKHADSPLSKPETE